MTEQLSNRDLMANGVPAPPPVGDPMKPTMDAQVAAARMPEVSALAAGSGAAPPSSDGGSYMSPAPSPDADEGPAPTPAALPDQEPPRGSGAAAAGSDSGAPGGYLRLRLAVEGGTLRVLDAWAVEGPLATEDRITGDLAYEVRRGADVLCVGSIPDAGEIRSFPNPDGPPEQQRHFVRADPEPEIAVRVPAVGLRSADLDQVQVRLYRIKSGAPQSGLAPAELAEEAGRGSREVASLTGVDLSTLPNGRAAEIRRVLG